MLHERVQLYFARKRRWRYENTISVIIPTHNRKELLLERALPSILAQSYQNLEIIVAAHGCTDGTQEAVKAIGDRRIIVLDVPRNPTYPPTPENHWFAGPVVPLNAALKAATGKWIARIDDDDEWTGNHLFTLLVCATWGKFEFVSAAHETHEGKVEPYILNGVKVGGCQTWLYRDYLKFMRYNPNCWRKKWNRVNDTDLQQRFRSAGVQMGYTDKIIAKVYPRPGLDTIGLRATIEDFK